ncbi:MAG: penicillin-binding protein activator [Gammaproteobacteria bacterium]|nr:penicillin-binding protein activator [Gammaproteobacteria bacterium]
MLLAAGLPACQNQAPQTEPAAQPPPRQAAPAAPPSAGTLAGLEQLGAAEAAVADSDWVLAQRLLSQVDADALNHPARKQFHQAALATALGLDDLPRAEAAWHSLAQGLEGHDQDASALRLLSELRQRQGRIREAVAALAGIKAPEQRLPAINNRLWRLTATVSPQQAAAWAEQGPAAAVWGLRAAVAQSPSTTEKDKRLEDWLSRHPRHSFAKALPEPLARLRHRPPPARRVGLFIPLTGPLAAAGRTVRDGFISAYLRDPAAAKPEVRIFDTASEPMAALLQAGRSTDIQFIVGPLSKPALESLMGLRPRMPVLALNYPRAPLRGDPKTPMDGDPPTPMRGDPPTPMRGDACGGGAQGRPEAGGGFAALGLAIEDEAALIAERLAADGRERVLVIRNGRSWAIRGTSQLARSWPHHLEQHAFDNIKTLTESVGEALQVASSQARHDELAQALGTPLEFLPRARQDIDGIVAFVDHLQALALAPALKFHFAQALPVYASSQSVRGAGRLGDLEGFQVAELPFQLRPGPLRQAFSEAFEPRDANLTALFALGIDAYRLFDHWTLLSAGDPLRGATGTLRLGADGCVRRTLGWAAVRGGALSEVPGGPSN